MFWVNSFMIFIGLVVLVNLLDLFTPIFNFIFRVTSGEKEKVECPYCGEMIPANKPVCPNLECMEDLMVVQDGEIMRFLGEKTIKRAYGPSGNLWAERYEGYGATRPSWQEAPLLPPIPLLSDDYSIREETEPVYQKVEEGVI